MADIFRDINPVVNRTLSPLTASPGSNVLKLLLVLFGATAAPKLPSYMLRWFDHVAFKIGFIAMIMWTSNYDPAMSIVLAIVFYVAFSALEARKAKENFETGQR
jgi:hypothetical protein